MKQILKKNPLWMIVHGDIDKLEHNAVSQYKFNRFWAIVWFFVMVAIPTDPKLYVHSISALIITEISLWANFATHFGAMSASLAAANTSQTITGIVDNVSDVSDDVDDIKEVTDTFIASSLPLGS